MKNRSEKLKNIKNRTKAGEQLPGTTRESLQKGGRNANIARRENSAFAALASALDRQLVDAGLVKHELAQFIGEGNATLFVTHQALVKELQEAKESANRIQAAKELNNVSKTIQERLHGKPKETIDQNITHDHGDVAGILNRVVTFNRTTKNSDQDC